jgi:hypothetical protein
MELHVDYWNRLGWTDPFSSAQYSERQSGYSKAFGRRGIYTPQMVIDGATEVLGSDQSAANTAIAAAAQTQHVHVALQKQGAGVAIGIAAQPGVLEVWGAEVERALQTEVPRGENSGRTLLHGPVVRALYSVALTVPGSEYVGRIAAPDAGGRALVVFVADAATRKVYGAAELR